LADCRSSRSSENEEFAVDKTIAGLIGAVGTLAAVSPSQAAPAAAAGIDEAMHAASYADLLKPIPNATALLRASDARAAEAPAKLLEVQYYYRHHHHHHHSYYRRPVYHHHHHHAYYRRPLYHHHHHHHRYVGPGVGVFIR
jgi:hypothetical protein